MLQRLNDTSVPVELRLIQFSWWQDENNIGAGFPFLAQGGGAPQVCWWPAGMDGRGADLLWSLNQAGLSWSALTKKAKPARQVFYGNHFCTHSSMPSNLCFICFILGTWLILNAAFETFHKYWRFFCKQINGGIARVIQGNVCGSLLLVNSLKSSTAQSWCCMKSEWCSSWSIPFIPLTKRIAVFCFRNPRCQYCPDPDLLKLRTILLCATPAISP